MDRKTNERMAKLISVAVGCVIAWYVFKWMLPYLEPFLALCGAWYLWREYERTNRPHRH